MDLGESSCSRQAWRYAVRPRQVVEAILIYFFCDISLLTDELGRYLCLGRRIALAEIRMVVALLLTKYTVRPAPGEDGTQIYEQTRDQFAAHPGPFNILFEGRAL